MNRKTVVLALLDKAWPPEHSFVDGMLVDVVAKEKDIKMRLCVSYSGEGKLKPKQYRSAVCIPRLFPRRGVGRFKNLWSSIQLIQYQVRREKQRGNRVVLFVRNDPILLSAASIMRSKVDRVVFQSSFPHEEFSGSTMKRSIAKLLYRMAGRGVDIVTGVSPEGAVRAQHLCPTAKIGDHIPLLADLPLKEKQHNQHELSEEGPTFVYIGTHSVSRELPTVLRAIIYAVEQGAKAKFRFIGGNEIEQNQLKQLDGVNKLIEQGFLSLERSVPRNEIPKLLSSCDIGISLIPPKPVYYESSPTKLAEYMGAGLAVLASTGIPMQERFVNESGAGVLVDWSVSAIAEGILNLSEDYSKIKTYSDNAVRYSKESLQYSAYLPQFKLLLKLKG